MRALAVALLLAAAPAFADHPRDDDRIVVNERAMREDLDQLERLLEKIDAEKNKHQRAKLVSKARAQVDALQKRVRNARELDRGPAPVRPAPPPPVVVRPPPPPPAPVVYPIAEAPLRDLLRAINAESFPRDRLRVLAQAAPAHWFRVDQAQKLLARFDFPKDRLEAMRYLRPRMLDSENFYKLYASFEYPSDKAELKRILQ